MNNFEESFKHLVVIEGGYSDNENDTGGKTNFGITEKVARENGFTGKMKDLTIDNAKSIYKAKYWASNYCDKIAEVSPELAHEIFDTSVNMGTKRAAKFLQRALNCMNRSEVIRSLKVDGWLGAKTLENLFNIVKSDNDKAVIYRLCNGQQIMKYMEICEKNESQKTFIRGWILKRT